MQRIYELSRSIFYCVLVALSFISIRALEGGSKYDMIQDIIYFRNYQNENY